MTVWLSAPPSLHEPKFQVIPPTHAVAGTAITCSKPTTVSIVNGRVWVTPSTVMVVACCS